MIAEQRKIIDELKIIKRHFNKSEIASWLGIDRTRYFRILNGYEMKLSEYLTIKRAIQETINCITSNEIEKLSPGMRHEFSLFISRGLRMKKLVEKINDLGRGKK